MQRVEGAAFVEMHGKAAGHGAARGQRIEETARPSDVVAVGAAAHQVDAGLAGDAAHVAARADQVAERRVVPELGRGGFRLEVAAATPQLIADAPVFHAERLGRSIGGAFVGKRAALGVIAVFDPVLKFLRRPGSHVGGEVRLGADQFAEADEFVRAEAVVLGVMSPVDVHAPRPLCRRTDAVAPVIIVGETASRPAQHGHAELLQIIHRRLAVAIDVRDRRILPHPNAAIGAAAQMLGEVRMQLGTDGRDLFGGVNGRLLRGGRLTEDAARQQGRKRGRGAGAGELTASDGLAHFVGNLSTPGRML